MTLGMVKVTPKIARIACCGCGQLIGNTGDLDCLDRRDRPCFADITHGEALPLTSAEELFGEPEYFHMRCGDAARQ
jgi:hypothetical protein